MKNRLIAGLLSAAVLAGISAIPAEAACKGATHCYGTTTKTSYASKHASSHIRKVPAKTASAASRKRVHVVYGTKRVHVASSAKRVHVASATKRVRRTQTETAALAVPAAANASQGNVISLIKAMAPSQGVPTWFAAAHCPRRVQLQSQHARQPRRIWRVPDEVRHRQGHRLQGQLRCPARSAHQHPVGLRHLALAIGKSDGNLRLAASKHNGGLGRRTIVASYVARVF